MSLNISRRASTIVKRVGALLAAAGLVFAAGAPIAVAADALPPPTIMSIEERSDGGVRIVWRMNENHTGPNGTGYGLGAPGPWGYAFNVYIEQTGEKIHTEAIKPRTPNQFTTEPFSMNVSPAEFFENHGTTKETRYCITMQSYVGDGFYASSQYSAETKRTCVGTQSVLIVTPGEPLPSSAPPPPTKPDLMVTRVTGPTTVSDGDTPVYEIVLWNDGTPAKGTAQIQIEALGPLALDSMVQLPDGFTCDTNDFGVACVGSLGGLNDPTASRGVTFKMQMRANGTGKAAVIGDANHDRALDEMTVDNNMKTLDVTVK
jgi:hypothetical protein